MKKSKTKNASQKPKIQRLNFICEPRSDILDDKLGAEVNSTEPSVNIIPSEDGKNP